MKVCLFGGTFDPPHIGHLLIAQTLCEAEKFDKILMIFLKYQILRSNEEVFLTQSIQ